MHGKPKPEPESENISYGDNLEKRASKKNYISYYLCLNSSKSKSFVFFLFFCLAAEVFYRDKKNY